MSRMDTFVTNSDGLTLYNKLFNVYFLNFHTDLSGESICFPPLTSERRVDAESQCIRLKGRGRGHRESAQILQTLQSRVNPRIQRQ